MKIFQRWNASWPLATKPVLSFLSCLVKWAFLWQQSKAFLRNALQKKRPISKRYDAALRTIWLFFTFFRASQNCKTIFIVVSNYCLRDLFGSYLNHFILKFINFKNITLTLGLILLLRPTDVILKCLPIRELFFQWHGMGDAQCKRIQVLWSDTKL